MIVGSFLGTVPGHVSKLATAVALDFLRLGR